MSGIDEKNVAERVISWLKEIGTPDNQVTQLTEKIATLETKLAEQEKDLKEANDKVAELTKERDDAKKELAEGQDKAELAEFTEKLDRFIESGKVIPAEKEGFVKLAETQSTEQRDQLVATLDARGESRIFSELTSEEKDKDKDKKKPSRAAEQRDLAEKKLQENPEDEDSKRILAACDLVDENEKLSFVEALGLAISQEV